MFLQKLKALKLWRRKPVIVLAVITLLLIIPCVINIFRPNKVYRLDEGYVFQESVPTEGTIVYDNIALKSGVYYVELYFDAEYEGVGPMAFSTVTDGTVITGGLGVNGQHLYAGMERTRFSMWLYENTGGIEVRVSYGGDGFLEITGCNIIETNQLWSMFITVILFCAVLGFTVLAYHYYDGEYRVSGEKKKVFFFVMLISFLASIPYLYRGNFAGIDLSYHLHRIEGVKDGIISGQIPLRIEPRWVYDHGYAAAVFYCDILLYFPAILRLLGFPLYFSYNVYCIVLTIATAAIAYYCFSRIFKSADIGILCCALYTLSTFRIYGLINTCALGESSAVTFMPLVLYGMYRVFAENTGDAEYRTAWIPIAVGYAGLIQTHVLSCEIIAFLTIVICLVFIRKIFCKNTFLQLAKGALAAVGLSAWFLIPFLDFYLTQDIHVKNLSARTIQGTGMTLAHLAFNFWRNGSYTPNGETGLYHTHPVGAGFILVLGLCVFCVMWFGGAFRKTEKKVFYLAVISAILGGFLLFMSTELFPWDAIHRSGSLAEALVSSLEFTHRVLGWGTLFLVTVCGFCLWYFQQKERLFYLAAVVAVVVSVITSSLYFLNFVERENGVVLVYNEAGMGFGAISAGEYLLEGTQPEMLTFRKSATAGEGVSVSEYEKNYLNVKMNCSNESGAESYVDIPMLFYRGYRAVDDTGEKRKVCAGENNVVRVILPEGFSGGLEVSFVSPFYWRIGELVSVVVFLAFLILIYRGQRGKKKC